jgi:hypothetical protein
MDNVELNINNYTFNDILNLFKINMDYDDNDLLKCKKNVEKIYSSDGVSLEYCNLFRQAYKELYEYYFFKNKMHENNSNSINDNSVVNNNNSVLNNNNNVLNNNSVVNNSNTDKYIPSLYKKNLLLSDTCYSPYLMITKMITIHTEDRDILKYPNENEFEIEFPSVYRNILSIELNDITLPTFYYNISYYLQNSKLWFSIPLYFTEPIEITIPDGYYDYIQLASIIKTYLNDASTSMLYSIGAYVLPNTLYTYFDVSYNENQRKYEIINTADNFILWFNKESEYDTCHFNCWKMKQYWGLSYNMGFFKEMYVSVFDTKFNYFILKSVMIIKLEIVNTIYMEINTYNWIDEVNPFSISTNSYYNNDYNGRVDNAFAKLVLSNVNNNYVPIKKYKRILPHVVERISKLYFSFRYHNGIPVDFMHQDFNFALKLECRFNCDR